MLKERLKQLFVDCDQVTQELIAEVLELEQAHISMKNFHWKEQVDQIITKKAKKELLDETGKFNIV